MQEFRVSAAGRNKAVLLVITLGVVALYAAQKAWGLWHVPVRDSDPTFFSIDLAKVMPAGLLTLVVLAAVATGWFIVVELLVVVALDETGICFKAPGLYINYR
jgi:hypothetical protein